MVVGGEGSVCGVACDGCGVFISPDCEEFKFFRQSRLFFLEFSEGFVSPGSNAGMAPGATSISKKRKQRGCPFLVVGVPLRAW